MSPHLKRRWPAASAHPAPRAPTQCKSRGAPIRVLFVKDRLHETGGTLYYLEMLPRLDPTRVTPLLCVFAPRHPIASRFEAAGIRPTFFGRVRWDPRCLIDLVRFARSCDADLLHLEGCSSFPFGRLGARALGLPSALHFHCMLSMPWTRAFLNRHLKSPRWAAIAVSEAVRRWAIQELGIAPDRVRVLYNAVDVERFASPRPAARASVRDEFGIGGDVPVIGLIGRLDVAQKGHDMMIRAMSAVRVRRSDAVLLLVGDGPDRVRCEALVHELGLDEAARFAGHRADIADILAAVDVVVMPSVCEDASPLVALEASAAGRPVVAFESGGLPELILHDRTGLIVPKGDMAGLSEATLRLLDEPHLASRLGEAGARRAYRFDLSQHASALMAFCEGALDEHRQSKTRASGREKRELTTGPGAPVPPAGRS
jgi:glycosyltransferase involved in cell wall biosynthesis